MKFPDIREQVNHEVEGLELQRLKEYNVAQTNLTKFINGSNPITKNLLKFASEVYGQSEQWFLYGDLKDYIYTLFNPDRKTMRVPKVDAEKLAIFGDGANAQILENTSFVHLIWIRKESRMVVLSEKEKQKLRH